MAKITHVVKRTGAVVPFNKERITNAIYRAAVAVGGRDRCIAEGLADPWSDIDFAVIVDDESFDQFVNARHAAPEHWGELLFNSGAMGRNMCMSHFEPFIKVDVFYYRTRDLKPSPWFARPIRVEYDRLGVVEAVIRQSKLLTFAAEPSTANHIVNQAMASAHEVIRRLERGELAYAQSILTSLRENIAQVDDLLHDRAPLGLPRFETRCDDPNLQRAIAISHPQAHDPGCILAALQSLVGVLQRQMAELEDRLLLARNKDRDRQSLSLVTEWKLPY